MSKRSFEREYVGFHIVKGFLFILSLWLISDSTLFAQEVTGEIQGVVRDQSGGVIPRATVTATSKQRGHMVITDNTGTYRFANLMPALYKIAATAGGFKEAEIESVTVELGRVLQVNLTLELEGPIQTVTITTGKDPIVDSTSSKTATNITQERIEFMPKASQFFERSQTRSGNPRRI